MILKQIERLSRGFGGVKGINFVSFALPKMVAIFFSKESSFRGSWLRLNDRK